MFDIFDLLTITWRFFQSFDHQSSSRWNDVNLCLTILNCQFNGYPQTFPALSGLGDIVTNFLGRQTKWTNFGSQGRGSCYLSIGSILASCRCVRPMVFHNSTI